MKTLKTTLLSTRLGAALLGLALVSPAMNLQAADADSQEAERDQCAGNLKQIYRAIRAYQLDHQDLPPWLSSLVPKYLPDKSMLLCPTHRRTGGDALVAMPDPVLATSYLYEFCMEKVPSDWASIVTDWKEGITMKEWKLSQLRTYGADVPLIRCWHHTPVQNLAFSGEVFESGQMWETKLNQARALQVAAPGPLPLDQWFPAGSRPQDYRMGVEPEMQVDGRPVGYLRSIANEIAGFGTLMEQFQPDRYRGHRLQMAAKLKGESIQGSLGIWMRVDGPDGEVLTFDNMQNRPLTGTVDWTDCRVVLDIPEETQMIAAGILLSGTGNAWITGVTFEEVSQEVPSTNLLDEEAE